MKSYVLDPTPVSALVEITSVAAGDWLVVFRDGELVANKAHPGAVTRFSASAPTALGTASAGSETTVSRSDHVHPMPSASDVSALPIGGGTLTGALTSRTIVPDVNNTRALGSSDATWNHIYTQNCTINGVVTGSLTPNGTNTYNLGALGNRWNEIHGNTIYQGGSQVSNVGHTHDYAASTHAHGNIDNAGKITGSTNNLPLITGTGGVITTGSFGTGANTFCQGNDARLSDARAPTSHTHGNLSNDGKVGTDANKPLITGTDGAITTGSFGTTANTFCQGNDSRLSDARTPTTHSHAIGDLPTTTNNPAALGTASPGNATTVARSNHVHPMPSASDVSALPIGGGTLTGALTSRAIVPDVNNTRALGSSDATWNHIYTQNCTINGVVTGSLTPNGNGVYLLGASGNRWKEIWCTQSDLNSTSDQRAKTDLIDSDLGLAFVRALRPVRYRWAETTDLTKDGQIKKREGIRPHYGLVAQQVKQVMADRDFGGYVYDPDTDVYALRYGEFVAPLIRAVQELSDRVEELERNANPNPRSPRA